MTVGFGLTIGGLVVSRAVDFLCGRVDFSAAGINTCGLFVFRAIGLRARGGCGGLGFGRVNGGFGLTIGGLVLGG